MNKVSILDFDINNGEGVRVSLWVSGCPHKCFNCHNSSYWDNKVGTLFTDKDMDFILELLEKDMSKDFSVLGGEPLAPYNLNKVTEICQTIKTKYPNKSIWIWTGYLYEEVKDYKVLKYTDVLIDGKYIDSLHKDNLMWKGSSNQRVISVAESLKQNKVILYME